MARYLHSFEKAPPPVSQRGVAACCLPLRRTLLVLLLTCIGTMPVVSAADTPLPPAVNLMQDATASVRQGMPLIVLVSLTGCQFCERIRRQHLAPMAKFGVMIRQVYLDSDSVLTDFAGKPITQRHFAQAFAVKVAPTVLFFDAQGVQLADALVGAMIDDYYSVYLDQAIATAKKALAARS